MEQPHNIVLILGNGFDLDLGLKTSYKDFWESDFCPKDYPAPLIFHLKQAWGEHLNGVKWFDLENELLNYYNRRQLNANYPDVIDDVESKYLFNHTQSQVYNGPMRDEDEPAFNSLFNKGIIFRGPLGFYVHNYEDLQLPYLDRDKKALELIKNGLCKYLSEIFQQEPSRDCLPFHVFNTLVNNHKTADSLNIYSFNYTTIPWEFSSENQSIVHNVHGNCDDGKIILGTRDESLSRDYCFLQKSFDKHFSPPPIVGDLAAADEVIIFGHSLGINDRQYFKPFFMAQSRNEESKRKTIIIITKDDSSVVEIKRSLQQMTDNQLSFLMSKNNVKFIKTEMDAEDQEALKFFFSSHGVRKHSAEEIIGRIVDHKKERDKTQS